VKEFLSREGHAVHAKNVEEDDEAYRELMALGIWTVPVTLIDGRIVKGFDPSKLRKALADAAAESPQDR
jgi:glutaredoxin-like protein NrdH